MKPRTRTFQKKLFGCFVLFTAVIFTVLWLVQTVLLQSFYNRMIMNNTRAAADKINAYNTDEDVSEKLDEISRNNSLLIYVTDEDGNLLYSADEYKKVKKYDNNGGENVSRGKSNKVRKEAHLHYRELPDEFEEFFSKLTGGDAAQAQLLTENMYFYGKYIEYEEGKNAILFVGTNLNAMGSTARIIRIQLLIVSVLSVAIGFILAFFMSRSFSRPIAQLNRKARSLGEDVEKTDDYKGFCAELDELDSTLDRTDEKLKKNKEFQHELLANVSHDLRTPLTMIKGYAEMIRDISHEDADQCTEDVAVIVRESDRLTALVNEIMEYSELQMADGEPVMDRTDLSGLVSVTIDNFESLYSKEGYTFERKIAENIYVTANGSKLTRVVYNLVDNAIRHAGEDKWIGVALKNEQGKAVLEISDHGDGIAEEELEHLWDKYYTSRRRDGKGIFGLGLAIVKQIVIQHNGTYEAVSEPGKGSLFRIGLKTEQDH